MKLLLVAAAMTMFPFRVEKAPITSPPKTVYYSKDFGALQILDVLKDGYTVLSIGAEGCESGMRVTPKSRKELDMALREFLKAGRVCGSAVSPRVFRLQNSSQTHGDYPPMRLEGTSSGLAATSVSTEGYSTFLENNEIVATVSQDGAVTCTLPVRTKEEALKFLGPAYVGIYLALCNPPKEKP